MPSRRILGLLLVFVIVAAACGDDTDSSSDGGGDDTSSDGASDDGILFAPWTMDWGHLGAALFVAVVLTGAASFAPSWIASRRDPAAILQEE